MSPERKSWKKYIQDLREEDRNDLFAALSLIRDDLHAHSRSNRQYTLRKTAGNCTIEMIFSEGTTRICFNSTAISNKELANHVQTMQNKIYWKEYLQRLEEQDRGNLYSILAILQWDFHMYRGKSPSHLPSILPMMKGKCRAILSFKTGLTEISFNSITINNSNINEFYECLDELKKI